MRRALVLAAGLAALLSLTGCAPSAEEKASKHDACVYALDLVSSGWLELDPLPASMTKINDGLCVDADDDAGEATKVLIRALEMLP